MLKRFYIWIPFRFLDRSRINPSFLPRPTRTGYTYSLLPPDNWKIDLTPSLPSHSLTLRRPSSGRVS